MDLKGEIQYYDFGSTCHSHYSMDSTSSKEWTQFKDSMQSFDAPYDLHQVLNTEYGDEIRNRSSSSDYCYTGMDACNYNTNISILPHGYPYASALNTTNLKYFGDIMDMTFGWTDDERRSRRRLVRFRRQQNPMDCNQHFVYDVAFIEHTSPHHNQPLSHSTFTSEQPPSHQVPSNGPAPKSSDNVTDDTLCIHNNETSSVTVSCMYWKKLDGFFITSVDCLYLLENLIGIQFTVEDKNKARRNLEEFRPLTISKCKAASADFF
ncbi:hypothetical protein BC941DRAFT_45979 [Chlamydoabsidia padenii]|nr:hypothetical protein BC941DRAFT_45979 [Chlamydoabsidia padenii]